MFIEILFKMLLFKGGVLIYAEHCIYCIKKDLRRKKKKLYFILGLFSTNIDVCNCL